MRAVRYDAVGGIPRLETVPDPVCPPRGAVIAVRATGVCRSDWHAWQGHDDTVRLPHTPGHEFAGEVLAVAPEVERFAVGDRVTAPFILACGRCEQCRAGAPQVCPDQRQPGFDLPGSWAEQVVVLEADTNLVALPEGLGMVAAAGLGCRVGTAFHALHVQGRVRAGQHVAILGCGGLGLAAVMIARAIGAEMIAVDVSADALAAAAAHGATTVRVRTGTDPAPGAPDGADATHRTVADLDEAARRIRELTGGGAHVALDALGSTATARASIASLHPRGRHVQVGLMLGEDSDPSLPMGRLISQELEIVGSHGLGAAEYPALLAEVAAGRLDLDGAVGTVIGFEDLPDALVAMGGARPGAGMTVARVG
ncbi:alcohol dehydrogenase catalytic domain-containing protein [Brachybacterium huguangmaarense]